MIYHLVVVQSHLHRKSAPFRDGAKFEPLSSPLQRSIRFFLHPLPAPPFSSLREGRLHHDWVLHPRRERYWLTTFRMFHKSIGLGRLCVPGGTTGISARRQYSPTCPPMPFWLWGRMVTLAPLCSRYVIPRLHSHYPCRSFPE